MNYTQDNDKLYRYLFQNRAVRGEWVRLNQTFTDTLNTHHYPKAVQNLLGEMMVATNLLTATLKFNGNITVQIQGDGPLKLALVNGNDQQQIRALARVQGDIQDGMSLHDMIGKGVLVITIAPTEGERYQGVIGLDKPTITECLEDYFVRSEQLQTQLIIRTGEYEGKPVAAGMLLQIMPDGQGTPEDFEHLTTLAATVKDEELFGLPAEEYEKIFKPFYRVDEARTRTTGGTGLGLSIVAHTIKSHHGRVWANRSRLGGLAVTLSIPLWLGEVNSATTNNKTQSDA